MLCDALQCPVLVLLSSPTMYFEINLLLSTVTNPVSTHNPQVMSDRSWQVWAQVSSGVLLNVFNYILIYNDQTTLQAGAHRCGVDCRWAQRNESKKRRRKKGLRDACPLGQPKERKKNIQETSVSCAWCWVLWW
jgi:hypothetical protein